jgi:hypothetical protein
VIGANPLRPPRVSVPLIAMKLRAGSLAYVLLTLAWEVSPVLADIIYLTTGDVVIVEKTWVEEDEVRYQASSGVRSIPAKKIRRIQVQTPTSPPGPGGKYGIAVEVPASGNAPPGPFWFPCCL